MLISFNALVQPGDPDYPIEKGPAHLKMTLTTWEAAEYSSIGSNQIDRLLRKPNCPFALLVGTKNLVKGQEFEEFIRKKLVI